MMSALVTYQDVCFGYDRKKPPVLDRLALELQEGKITAILGPNGAGKTTLLNLTLGWLKPWSGTINLSGKPLNHYSRRAMGQQIALIPQAEHVPFEYSVMEYVLLGRAPYLPALGSPTGQDERIAFEALEMVGIIELIDHSMLGISGGERQLVLAARALAQQPRLLLLDEPTSHLDLSNKFRLVKILQTLRERGTTILMTTHEPDLALLVSDDAILMEKGKVFTSGTTKEVANGENLTRVYHVPVKIIEVDGRSQIVWM